MRPAVWAPAALVLGWTALWLATVPLGDFPLNDDWTYGLAVQSILQTGRLSLLPWSSANAFAQLYWGALFCRLFGFSYEVLRLSTAVLGAAGVLATYGLLRELRASAGVAALGALVVGCNPLYLSQSVTFMTDVPFAALTIVSFWLCARRLMAPAYGIGLLAVLIRQFAVVLPVAFAAAMLRRQRHSAGQWAALAGSVLAFLALHVGFQHWMVATHRTSGFEIPASALLHLDLAAAAQRVRSSAMPTLGALGMALLPFAAVLPRRIAGWAATLGLAGAMLTLLIWKHELPPLPGNVVTRFGIGPLTLTDTYDMKQHLPSLPGAEGFWLALSVGACWGLATGAVSIVTASAALFRGPREGADAQGQAALLVGFIVAYGAALIALATIAPLFDRYLIPLLAPTVAVIALANRDRGSAALALGAALVAAMAAFSVGATHDWLAWHRSRWEAVRSLTERSIPPSSINGGYEFNGLTTYRPTRPGETGKPGWWVVDDAFMLAAGPMAGFQEIASIPVQTWLWRRGARIAVLRRE